MMMMSDMDDSLLQEFLVESREHLETIEPDLLILETQQEGADHETINRIFRAIHTIKGASGFFGLEAIKRLSHVMENMLMAFRDGKMCPSPTNVDPLLQGVDLLRQMVDNVSESETVPYQEVYHHIESIMNQGEVPPKTSVTTPTTPTEPQAWFCEQPTHTHALWERFKADTYIQSQKEGCYFYLLSGLKEIEKTSSFCDSVGLIIAKDDTRILLSTVIDPELMRINVDGIATLEHLPFIEPMTISTTSTTGARTSCDDTSIPCTQSTLDALSDESETQLEEEAEEANVALHEAMAQWGFAKDLIARFPSSMKSQELLQMAAEGYHLYMGIDLLPSVRKQLPSFAKVYYSDEIGDLFFSVVEHDILLKTLEVDAKHLLAYPWPKAFTIVFAEYRKKLNDHLVKIMNADPTFIANQTVLTDPEFYVRQGFPSIFTEYFLPDANTLRQHVLVGERPYILMVEPKKVDEAQAVLSTVGTVIEQHKTPQGLEGLLFMTVLEPLLLEATLEGSVHNLSEIELPQGYKLQIESLRKQMHLQQQLKAKQVSTPAVGSSNNPSTLSTPGATTANTVKTPPKTSNTSSSGINPEVETVRVKIDLLDRLMDMVGELVLCRNQLVRSFNNLSKTQALKGGDQTDQQKLSSLVQNMSFIATSLQDRILQMRMQTLDGLFKKFPRVVRDLSQSLQKDIAIEISGQDVELDKSVIEVLSDPLTHMIRNCCDHAIETPQEREVAGKNPRGTIRLRAYHNVGRIHVEVVDDGRGIDPEKVGSKALEKGLVSQDKLDTMSEQDIIQLVFLPGFSTAEKVTDVSGRGVGMDVVRSKIEKVGGSVSIHSEVGVGTTFTIKIPLTLAIINSLIVSVQGKRFAIPQVNILEILRIGNSTRTNEWKIDRVGNTEVVQLRGELLPLVRLEKILHWDSVTTAPSVQENGTHTDLNILVLRHGDHQYGLVVNRIEDLEEIVMKPLSGLLHHTRCFSGTTILGDGSVVMILDPQAIANMEDLQFCEKEARKTFGLPAMDARVEECVKVLLFKNHEAETFAVPLRDMLRIEQIDLTEIKVVSGREFIECRGHMLSIIRLEDYLPVRPAEFSQSTAYLLLPKLGCQKMGVLISEFMDEMDVNLHEDEQLFEEREIRNSVLVEHELVPLLDINLLLKRNGIFKEIMENAELLGGSTPESLLSVLNTNHAEMLSRTI
jgi:chemotaxis protein histidine kinase CheA